MPVTLIRFFVAVHVSVQEVLFGFQGAMPHFCRLLPGRIRVLILLLLIFSMNWLFLYHKSD